MKILYDGLGLNCRAHPNLLGVCELLLLEIKKGAAIVGLSAPCVFTLYPEPDFPGHH